LSHRIDRVPHRNLEASYPKLQQELHARENPALLAAPSLLIPVCRLSPYLPSALLSAEALVFRLPDHHLRLEF
jgi:hypothetical protein